MKILIPVLGFSKSGGYRTLSRFATEFVKAGHSVTFLVNHNSDEPYFPTSAAISWVNGFGWSSQQREASKRKQSFISSFFSILFGCWRARKQFDVVIANHSLTVLPIHISGIKAKKIYYIQAYEPEYYLLQSGFKNRFYALLSRYSYKLEFKQVVNSNLYCSYKEIKTDDVVFPGIDLDIFYRKSAKETKQRPLVLGTIARTEKQKGTHYIVEAFGKLAADKRNVIFKIAFPDNLPRTSFTYDAVTPQTDTELADFYRSIDVYVSAGTVQFGAVHYPVIESMACGTLVCTTPYYPAGENNALMLEPEKAVAIVTAVEKLLNGTVDIQNLVQESEDSVLEFSWKNQFQRFSTIIKNSS